MTPRPTLETQLAAADLQIIDAICDRFETDHRTGGLVDLASYLSEAPAGCRAVLFGELLNLELELRHENGERPDARSYHRQFPDLGNAINAVFESRANRVSTVRRKCSSDRDGGTTVATPDRVAAGTATAPWTELTFVMGEQPGLPGYQIRGELGRGGMGVVLKAHQVALNRPVAIKLIKSGTFATENELSAFKTKPRLSHSSIILISCRFTKSANMRERIFLA